MTAAHSLLTPLRTPCEVLCAHSPYNPLALRRVRRLRLHPARGQVEKGPARARSPATKSAARPTGVSPRCGAEPVIWDHGASEQNALCCRPFRGMRFSG